MVSKGTVVGLDIGRQSVKAAWVRLRGKRPVVVRTEMLRLPAERQDNRGIIKSWAEKVGLARTPCVVGVAGQYCMFQPIALAAEDARGFDQVAAMEVLQFNEMASETMVYGHAPLTLKPGERRMMLAMARPMALGGLLDLGREVGVRVTDLVPCPAALFNLLEACAEPHAEPHLYVCIGHSTTELAVGGGGGLAFARSFGSGGQMFTDALGRALKLPATHAEATKIKDASLQDGSERGTALRACADLWLAELRSCLSVYRSLYAATDLQPKKIVLAGKGAALRGLAEYIAEKTALPVVPAAQAAGAAIPDDPGMYAVAAGLGLSGFDAAPVRLSLLPPDVRSELMFRRQKPFWIAAGVTATLILGVSLGGGYRDIRRKQDLLEVQKTSLKRRQQLVAQIEAVRKGTEYMVAMGQPVGRLVEGGPVMRDLIAVLAKSIGDRDWISMVCDAESYFWYEPPPLTPQTGPGAADARRKKSRRAERTDDPAARRQIIVEGFTRVPNLTTVQSLITALRAQTFVASADLLSDNLEVMSPFEGDSERFNARRFVIELRLKDK